jgi:hypothetical protein
MTTNEALKQALKENYSKIQNSIINKAEREYRNPGEITLVAVSKTFPAETIKAALEIGIRIFGENYAQEIRDKIQFFNQEAKKPQWHFIGHLQTNKVKYLIPHVKLIHTVDSIELAEEIDKRIAQHNLTQNVLIQVNTSGETSKYGIEPDDAVAFAKELQKYKNIKTIGLMTIGTFSDDELIIRKEFSLLRNLKNEINKNLGVEKFTELSMGMSHDYLIAIEEGSTILRIGTAIFGNRNYNKL